MRRAVGIAAVAILIFDVVWPLAYRAFPGRRDGLTVAFTIVSVGIALAISLKLAPDLQDGPLAIESVLITIAVVMLFYAVLGCVGAVVGRRLRQAP